MKKLYKYCGLFGFKSEICPRGLEIFTTDNAISSVETILPRTTSHSQFRIPYRIITFGNEFWIPKHSNTRETTVYKNSLTNNVATTPLEKLKRLN